jgi:prolyl-tRNA editing enzyme YbaK/EbsC (Cys-tRNA(Pro) deacylase)
MCSKAVAKVEASLRAAGVVAEFRSFEKPVPTAAAAAKALGCEVGAIANSLVFTTDGQPLLVLVSGAHRVNTTALAKNLNIGKIRRATTDFVLTHTGQHIGGVAPVGHPGKVRTVVDTALAEFPVVWAGAGDEHTMFATGYHDLLTATEGAAASVA